MNKASILFILIITAFSLLYGKKLLDEKTKKYDERIGILTLNYEKLRTDSEKLHSRIEHIENDFSLAKSAIFVANAQCDIYTNAIESTSHVIATARTGSMFRRTSQFEKESGLVPVEFPVGGEIITGYTRAENLRREMIDLGTFYRYGNVNPVDFLWQREVMDCLQRNSLKRIGIGIVNRANVPAKSADDLTDYVLGRLTGNDLTIVLVKTDDDDIQSIARKGLNYEAFLQIIIDDGRIRIRLGKFDGTVLYSRFMNYSLQ